MDPILRCINLSETAMLDEYLTDNKIEITKYHVNTAVLKHDISLLRVLVKHEAVPTLDHISMACSHHLYDAVVLFTDVCLMAKYSCDHTVSSFGTADDCCPFRTAVQGRKRNPCVELDCKRIFLFLLKRGYRYYDDVAYKNITWDFPSPELNQYRVIVTLACGLNQKKCTFSCLPLDVFKQWVSFLV